MTTIQLTPAQHAILAYAIRHTGGKIRWFPDNIRGGARTKVLEGLFSKARITRDSTDWFVAAGATTPWGAPRPTPATLHPDPEVEAAVSAAEANWAQEKQDAAKRLLKGRRRGQARTRENSKQAAVIQMLQRPEAPPSTRSARPPAGRRTVRAPSPGFKKKNRTHHHLGKARGRRGFGFTSRLEFEMGWRYIHATPNDSWK